MWIFRRKQMKFLYEEFMEIVDYYAVKAIESDDLDLKLFYLNVSNNYNKIALDMSIDEAMNRSL